MSKTIYQSIIRHSVLSTIYAYYLKNLTFFRCQFYFFKIETFHKYLISKKLTFEKGFCEVHLILYFFFAFSFAIQKMLLISSQRKREWEWVCESERERERVRKCVRVRERERDSHSSVKKLRLRLRCSFFHRWRFFVRWVKPPTTVFAFSNLYLLW